MGRRAHLHLAETYPVWGTPTARRRRSLDARGAAGLPARRTRPGPPARRGAAGASPPPPGRSTKGRARGGSGRPRPRLAEASGPRRENVCEGSSLSKRPSAAATRAGRSSGVGGDGRIEGLPRGDRPADALERHAVGEPLLDAAGAGPALQLVELLLRRQVFEPRRRLQRGDERRAARGKVRMEDVVGAHRGRRVRLAALHLAPLARRALGVPARQEREAEMKAGDAAVGLLGDERLQTLHRPVGPGGDRRADRGLDGVGIARRAALRRTRGPPRARRSRAPPRPRGARGPRDRP